MSDVDMSNSDIIKIGGVPYTKAEARILVAIVNKWLNENAVQHRMHLTAFACGVVAGFVGFLVGLFFSAC